MQHLNRLFLKITLAVFLCTLFISCSKDADLLSDFVINKTDDIAGVYNIVVDDAYFTDMKSSIVLDVLNNDNFQDFNNVKVIQTSDPQHGIVQINEDNTLTYIPAQNIEEAPENGIVDNFEYTAEETNPQGEVSTAEGSVTVKLIPDNEEVQYWKRKFDAEWTENDQQIDSQDALRRAKSGNVGQEYYFLAYYVDGLIKIWQATGDNSYLDKALDLINITVNDAINVGGGYKGWPNNENNGYALWDSYYWRYVATLVRIMHQSPILRSTKDYQNQYEKLLAFSEKNIWERYEKKGLNQFYRINTHMSSHWARIGMELYLITGKSKYKTVFDNISYGKMVNRPSNLRNHFKSNKQAPSAYTWSQRWDISLIQDTDHAGAIVSFITNAYENNMYWNKSDIDALLSTLNNVIWKKQYGSNFKENVDGTGDYDLHGRIHEWLNLGKYDQELQNRIKSSYIGKNLTYYGVQPLGIAALNARILEDGKPIYPEQ